MELNVNSAALNGARGLTTLARPDQPRPVGAVRKPGHVRIGARVEITADGVCGKERINRTRITRTSADHRG